MNTLNPTSNIPGLLYGNLETYFISNELFRFADDTDALEDLEEKLDLMMTPEKAEKAKAFILHMYAVQYHLNGLLFDLETETARSEEGVIRGYLSDSFIDEDDKRAANDAAIILRNRDLFKLEQMGLKSVLVS